VGATRTTPGRVQAGDGHWWRSRTGSPSRWQCIEIRMWAPTAIS